MNSAERAGCGTEVGMTPELWVTLAVGTVPAVATVAVAWINRRKGRDSESEDSTP
jgi:hypothetical protein